MQAVYRAKVVGVSASSGSFKDDSGKTIEFDNTKVHVELDLRGQTARGVATQDYKIGTSELYDKLKLASIQLPFIADITVRKTSNGREEREEVISFEPVMQKPAQAA